MGAKLDALTYKGPAQVRKILLFLNVRLDDCKRAGRFPFESYAEMKWDIEHVDSQIKKRPAR